MYNSEEVDNYCKTDKKKMNILFVKRDNYPFKDKWCLPGGFIKIDEDLDDAPKRILKKETNVDNIYLEQLYTFGNVDRYPRMRIVSTSYIALVDKNKIEYTDIVFNMMPELFTLGELQQVYEVILGKKLLDPAFRRIIKDKVEKTNKMKTGGGHRPSVLFRYRKK